MKRFALAAALLVLPVETGRAATNSAWSGNSGWVGFDPMAASRVIAEDTVLRGYAYAGNFGWIHLGDGSPASASAYSNASAQDYGVNHDGRGELSGYAYGANVGWINFGWASANDPDRPRVDLVTGEASGYAYSSNIGWISLNDVTMPGVRASVALSTGTENPTAGTALALNVNSAGAESLAYQWYLNGAAIPGADGASYLLPSVQRFHAGDYFVRITREDGSAFDTDGTALDATAPPPSDARLLNLSTRGLAQTGDNVLIPGFVISGTGTKRLLVRAVGPTLETTFDLSGVLPDPRIVLKRWNGTSYDDVASNDNWGNNVNVADIIQTAADVYAFGLKDDREAALLLELPAGQYTAIVDDENGGSGVGVVELYDADDSSVDARLINISTRGFVGTGSQVMIPGFVVSAEGPKTFLVRVVGARLAQPPFNLTGVLADPQLELHGRPIGGTDVLLFTQDNWSDNPDAANTAATASAVYAFGLEEGSADAAFVVTLQPGIYTVVGSATNGTSTGVALVEVYLVE